MRFYKDDLGIETEVEWYYVPENRPIVPFLSPFRSGDWILKEDQPILGEIAGTRSYFAGQVDDDLDGLGLCGSREQWENGCSILDPIRPMNPTTGQPCCCGPGSLPIKPDLVFDLENEVMTIPLVQVCTAPHLTPQYWICSDVNWQAHMNPPVVFSCISTAIMIHTGGCFWRGGGCTTIFGAGNFYVGYGISGATWKFYFSNSVGSPANFFYYQAANPWNQYGPNTLDLAFDAGVFLNLPPTVLIEAYSPP